MSGGAAPLAELESKSQTVVTCFTIITAVGADLQNTINYCCLFLTAHSLKGPCLTVSFYPEQRLAHRHDRLVTRSRPDLWSANTPWSCHVMVIDGVR